MQSMTWPEALQFAIGPGGAVIAGVLISILAEYWPAFQALGQKYKVAVYVGLCLLVPVGATALGILTAEFGQWGDIGGTWWPAIYSGIGAAGIGTLFHAWAPTPLRK